jgi:hypothetical protein
MNKPVRYETLNIKDITADFLWNSRFVDRAKTQGSHVELAEIEGDAECPGLEGLATSMASAGQDTPVDVAIPIEGAHKGKPFLITGFRRFAAIEWLASQNPAGHVLGLAPGEIKVCLHEGLVESEMRDINLRENVRDNLLVADLAYGVGERLKLVPKMKYAEIAAVMGKSTSYISNLATIVTGLKASVFREWRESTVRPLASDKILAIAKSPKSEQEELYKEACAAHAPRADKAGNMKWVDGCVKAATLLGKQLGTLQRLKLIKVVKTEDLEENIQQVVKIKATYVAVGADGTKAKKTTQRQTYQRITKALMHGYEDGLEPPDEDEEDETEGEDENE